MKICQLHFCNLNSLTGETKLDFEAEPFASAGIFAITGRTGAGKTTILDAICLALFACTPRIADPAGTGAEVMSRGTGECFSEVCFESGGKRYKIRWDQWRSRKRPDGKLQDFQWELSGPDGLLLTKKNAIREAVESITGMDFTRFTKAMLLAQGEFAAFLKAERSERAALLEKITGTGIYSELGECARIRRGAELVKLQELQTKLTGIQLPAEGELETLAAQKQEWIAVKRQLAAEADSLTGALQWRRRLEELRKQKSANEAALAEAEGLWAQFAPEKKRLEESLRALEPGVAHARLIQSRSIFTAGQENVHKRREAIAQLESNSVILQRSEVQHEQQLTECRIQFNEAAALWPRVRQLDAELKLRSSLLVESRRESDTLRQAAKAAHIPAAKLEEELANAKATAPLRTVQEIRLEREIWAKNCPPERIQEQLRMISMRKEWLQKASVEAARIAEERSLLKEELPVLEQETQQLRQAEAAYRLCEERAALTRQMSESADRELALLKKVELFRGELENGKPCPLCGSVEHPYALSDGLPSAESAAGRAASARESARSAENTRREEESRLHLLKARCEEHQRRTRQRIEELEKTEAVMTRELASKGVSPDSLTAEFEKCNSEIERLTDLNTRFNLLAEELAWAEKRELLAVRKEEAVRAEKLALEAEARFRADSAAESELRKKRKELFADRDPDSEEAAARKTLDEAVSRLETARLANARVSEQQKRNRDELSREEAAAVQFRLDAEACARSFEVLLAKHGFADEAAFAAAVLPEEERGRLSLRQNELRSAVALAAASLEKTCNELNSETERALTEADSADLQERLSENRQHAEACVQRLTRLQIRSEEFLRAQQESQELGRALQTQQREYDRWARLHGLIGVGESFRAFAQGITFDLVLMRANEQLRKLTDRYTLIKNRECSLALDVVDHYQAGEVRSSRNLSGGESFLVSLALSLGLSQISSRNIRIDSLFLDEGFGTLDEETLSTVLDTLSQLRCDGKNIGVISHVPQLQERIPVQIRVESLPGGHSKVCLG